MPLDTISVYLNYSLCADQVDVKEIPHCFIELLIFQSHKSAPSQSNYQGAALASRYIALEEDEYNMPCSRDLNGPYTHLNTQGRHLYLFLPLPTGTADVLQMYAVGHKVWDGSHRIRIYLPSEGTF